MPLCGSSGVPEVVAAAGEVEERAREQASIRQSRHNSLQVRSSIPVAQRIMVKLGRMADKLGSYTHVPADSMGTGAVSFASARAVN